MLADFDPQLQTPHALPHNYGTYSFSPTMSVETSFDFSSSLSCFNPFFSQSGRFEDIQLPSLLSPRPKDPAVHHDGGDEDEDDDVDDDFEPLATLPYPNRQKEIRVPHVTLASSHDLYNVSHPLTDLLDPKSSHLHMQFRPVAAIATENLDHWVAHSSAATSQYSHDSELQHFHVGPLLPAQPISPHVFLFEPFAMDPFLRPLQAQETVDLYFATEQTYLFNASSLHTWRPNSLSPSPFLGITPSNSMVESPPLTPSRSSSRHIVDEKAKKCSTRGFKNRTYKSTRAMKRPIINCNHKDSKESSSNIGKKARKVKCKLTTFVCDAPGCGKSFSRAYNLTSHLKTHSADRPFLCGACPLAFARRHDRERHARLHSGEKPYACESCGCGFMRNDALHRHQRICGEPSA